MGLQTNIFAEFSTTSCYWAGFLAADGWVTPSNGIIGCCLAGIDRSHVEKLHRAMGCDNTINFSSGKHNQTSLQISSAGDAITSLRDNFNVTSRKSLTLRPPDSLQTEDYCRSYIRGYMDGDGYISRYGGKNRPNTYVGFAGTYSVMEWIKSIIQKYVRVGNPAIYKHKNCNVHQLIFGGRQAERILSWLYKDSSDDERLERKYSKYLEIA